MPNETCNCPRRECYFQMKLNLSRNASLGRICWGTNYRPDNMVRITCRTVVGIDKDEKEKYKWETEQFKHIADAAKEWPDFKNSMLFAEDKHNPLCITVHVQQLCSWFFIRGQSCQLRNFSFLWTLQKCAPKPASVIDLHAENAWMDTFTNSKGPHCFLG